MSDILAPIGAPFAAIDVGTNSVKLIIADLNAPENPALVDTSVVTRIGEGMEAQAGRLREIPMRRTIDVVESYVNEARTYGIGGIAAVGTAALRDAENRDEFLDRVRDRCGLDIEVIPGLEEARLSYLAVRRDVHWRSSKHLLVIDVGGGSTEIIRGEPIGEAISGRISVRLGAVRLTEGYLRSDPPTVEQLAEATQAAADAFARSEFPAHAGEYEPPQVVGVGGTLTNIGAMSLGGRFGPQRLHGRIIATAELEERIAQLAAMTVEERKTIPGLDPRRADVILGGAIMLAQALARVGSLSVDVSTRGLRWGVLYDRFLP